MSVNESYIAEATETGKLGQEMVRALMSRGLIDGLSAAMEKNLFWKEKVHYDVESDDLQPTVPDEKVSTGGEHLQWDRYKNKEVVDQLRRALAKSGRYDNDTPFTAIQSKDVVDAFTSPVKFEARRGGKEMTLVMMRTKKNDLIPAIVGPDGLDVITKNITLDTEAEYSERGKYNTQITKSIIALANKEGGTLTKGVRLNNGIIKKDGKYVQFDPEKKAVEVKGEVAGHKVDFGHLDPADKLAALNYTLISSNVRDREQQGERDYRHLDDTSLKDRLMSAFSGQGYKRSKTHYGLYGSRGREYEDAGQWEGKELKDIYGSLYDGKIPDAVYLVDVQYGVEGDRKKHQVALVVAGDTIVDVDRTTTQHDFQTWDDFDDVANQLQQFADEHKLTFDKNALHKDKELRINRGRITTAGFLHKERLERLKARGGAATEGTDTLPFADGWTLRRMNTDAQVKWARKALKTDIMSGQAWELVDDAFATRAIALVKDDQVVAVYTQDPQSENKGEIPSRRNVNKKRLTKETFPHIKGAAEAFGWTIKTDSPQFSIKPNAAAVNYLIKAEKGYRRSSFAAGEGMLHQMGLISIRPTGGHYKRVYITPEGQEALAQIRRGEPVNLIDKFDAVSPREGWSAPERQQPQKKERTERTGRAPRVARTTGGTSKADMALGWFNAFADDKGRIPRRSEFIQQMQQEPFNMSAAGAQTYYYNTKKKYERQGGQQNESAHSTSLNLITEAKISPFASFFVSGRP